MNNILTNYTFNAASKTISFTGDDTIKIEGIKIITHIPSGTLIYRFNDPSKGGTISNNVLTLEFDTTSYSNSDTLQIIYDTPNVLPVNPATEETVGYLKMLLHILKPLGIVTGAGSNRLSIDINSLPTLASVTAVGSITSVTTVTTLSNISQMGGVNAFQMMKDISLNTFNNAVRSRIS